MRPLRMSSPRISRSVASMPRLSQSIAGSCWRNRGRAALPPAHARSAVAGLLAGWGVAIPLGAIGVMVVDLGMRGGFRPGRRGRRRRGHRRPPLRRRGRGGGRRGGRRARAARARAAARERGGARRVVALLGLRMARRAHDGAGRPGARAGAAARVYARFLALTSINPTTVAYFAALIAGLPAVASASAAAKAVFVLAAGAASLSWQLVLAGAGATLHHRLPPSARLVHRAGRQRDRARPRGPDGARRVGCGDGLPNPPHRRARPDRRRRRALASGPPRPRHARRSASTRTRGGAGDEVIEEHTEAGSDDRGHEELYVVLSGPRALRGRRRDGRRARGHARVPARADDPPPRGRRGGRDDGARARRRARRPLRGLRLGVALPRAAAHRRRGVGEGRRADAGRPRGAAGRRVAALQPRLLRGAARPARRRGRAPQKARRGASRTRCASGPRTTRTSTPLRDRPDFPL